MLGFTALGYYALGQGVFAGQSYITSNDIAVKVEYGSNRIQDSVMLVEDQNEQVRDSAFAFEFLGTVSEHTATQFQTVFSFSKDAIFTFEQINQIAIHQCNALETINAILCDTSVLLEFTSSVIITKGDNGILTETLLTIAAHSTFEGENVSGLNVHSTLQVESVSGLIAHSALGVEALIGLIAHSTLESEDLNSLSAHSTFEGENVYSLNSHSTLESEALISLNADIAQPFQASYSVVTHVRANIEQLSSKNAVIGHGILWLELIKSFYPDPIAPYTKLLYRTFYYALSGDIYNVVLNRVGYVMQIKNTLYNYTTVLKALFYSVSLNGGLPLPQLTVFPSIGPKAVQTLGVDFGNVLPLGVTLTGTPTVVLSAFYGADATASSKVTSSVIGTIPTLQNGSGLLNTAVLFQVSNLINGVTYQADITCGRSDGTDVLETYARFPCSVPSL